MKRKKRRMTKLTSFICLLIAAIPLAEAGKKKVVQEAYSIVAGTGFRESGFPLPPAEGTLIPNPQQDGAPLKVKKHSTAFDARRALVCSVSAARMHCTLRVA